MLICTIVYGLEKMKLYAIRCMLYVIKIRWRIAYSIKLEAFNPHNPRLNDTVGQAINLLKSWFRQ